MTLIRILCFLSAFLLFQIELIIGKIFLPNFGGSYIVWGACVVFFQAVLLLGYWFAHFVVNKFGFHRYRYWHSILLLMPLLFFPGRELSLKYAMHDNVPMVLDVFWHLFFSIGPVFFVLSTMSIICQVWLANSNLPQRKNPYALFAVSNFGSLLGLITYPFVFEMHFDLFVQQNIWRGLYLFLVFCQWVALFIIKCPMTETSQNERVVYKDKKNVFMWLLYGASGVMIFLSITNILTIEMTPMPLLWIFPLSIYLISFVFNFKQNPYCPGWIKHHIHIIMGFCFLFYFLANRKFLPGVIIMLIFLLINFVICMFIQYRLYASKPKDDRHLSYFYFMISLGSFLGGVLVTWVVPLISTTFVEYFLSFFVLALAIYLDSEKPKDVLSWIWSILACVLLMLWPNFFPKYNILNIGAILLLFGFIYHRLSRYSNGLLVNVIIIIVLVNWIEPIWAKTHYIYKHRNYYGISKIFDNNMARLYLHGTTLHGGQYLEPKKSLQPLTYYGANGAIGEMFRRNNHRFKHIGILGLGVGGLTPYFNEKQSVDYFEIEAEVIDMAKDYFSYLRSSPAKINHIVGDARLSLEHIPSEKYDLIIADAFSGDSIPVHLLTKEALTLYKSKLKPNGLIVLNMSNQYINNIPPVLRTASDLGAKVCFVDSLKTYAYTFDASWAMITWDQDIYDEFVHNMGWHPVKPAMINDVRPWTDKYSNIIPYIKWKEIRYNLKRYNLLKI